MVQLQKGVNTLYLNVSNYKSVGINPAYHITLTDESTQSWVSFVLQTDGVGGGWDGRRLKGVVTINNQAVELPNDGIINLEQPKFLEGFYQMDIYEVTAKSVLIGKNLAHLERSAGEDGYNRFESYNDAVTYKAYEE